MNGILPCNYPHRRISRRTWAGSTGTPPCTGTAITPGTLTAAQYTQSFSYDNQDQLRSSPLGSYSYDDAAHLHAATFVSSGTDDYSASYDASGNMTARASSESQSQQKLTWDNEGRLTAWQNAPSNPTSTAQYLYDGEGNRVEQQATTSGTTTTTVYVGALESVVTTGSTTTTTTYYYAAGQRIALAVNGTLSYLASDLLGSATVALDGSGTPTASQLYAPYGGVRYSNGTMPTDYGFTGQRADSATGLDYYGARYYDPTLGQFTSADTVLNGLNRYAYVGGNPISHTDPSGHYNDDGEGHTGPAVADSQGETSENLTTPQGGTPETSPDNSGGDGDGDGAGGGGFPVWLVALLIGAAGVVWYGAANTPTYYPPDADQGELARALARTGPDTDYWNQRNAPKSTPGKSTPTQPTGGSGGSVPQTQTGGAGAGGSFGSGGGAAPGSNYECGDQPVDPTIYLHHGTSLENARSIIQNGIDASQLNSGGAFFTTPSVEAAQGFAASTAGIGNPQAILVYGIAQSVYDALVKGGLAWDQQLNPPYGGEREFIFKEGAFESLDASLYGVYEPGDDGRLKFRLC